jgi:hypothetical protein
MTDHSASLSWDAHVAASEPLPSDDLAPGQEDRYWSPISATLISGERDALPVDALLTAGATDLTECVAAQALGEGLAAHLNGRRPPNELNAPTQPRQIPIGLLPKRHP